MFLAVDAQYRDIEGTATVGAVVFKTWGSPLPVHEYTCEVSGIARYVPGAFYERELPCILAALEALPADLSVSTIIVDGYVDLGGDRKGLGRHLYQHLGGKIAVVGVAKAAFRDGDWVECIRGAGSNPLRITAAGVSVKDAALGVASMHGPYRMPTLLKRVDQLARELVKPVVSFKVVHP